MCAQESIDKSVSEADAGALGGAEPGEGPGDAQASSLPPQKVKARPRLTPKQRALAASIGKNKLTPDFMPGERILKESWGIREWILDFLKRQAPRIIIKAELDEFFSDAANHCYGFDKGWIKLPRCSRPTAERWVRQYTAPTGPYSFREGGVGYWILEKRE